MDLANYGNGDGDGSGYGYGSGSGYGYGNGSGNGDGDGSGYGYGSGSGYGNGDGDGSGYGYGSGSGYGYGDGLNHTVAITSTHLKIGCQSHTFRFWLKHWKAYARAHGVSELTAGLLHHHIMCISRRCEQPTS